MRSVLSDFKVLTSGASGKKQVRQVKQMEEVKHLDEWIEITTPYLDSHNDYLQIYIQRRNGELVITDAGYILQDLELSGWKPDTPGRKALLMTTLKRFGVKLNGDVLEIRTSAEHVASGRLNLIEAMLAVIDLSFTVQ